MTKRDALDAVIGYIAQDSPQAAVQVLDDALRVGASLATFAEGFRTERIDGEKFSDHRRRMAAQHDLRDADR